MKLILGLVFQIGGLGVSGTRVMSHKLTRVKPHTPTSYLMMPYQSMALNHDYFKLGGWVENSKITGRAHASTPSSNLLSDLSNEQIKKPSQGLPPVTSSEFPYPAAAPLCLTRVKFPGTKVLSLFV